MFSKNENTLQLSHNSELYPMFFYRGIIVTDETMERHDLPAKRHVLAAKRHEFSGERHEFSGEKARVSGGKP